MTAESSARPVRPGPAAGALRAVPDSIAARLPAAAELIADSGLDDTKMEDIAAAVGVSKNTLYYYFAGKEELLAYLLADGLRTISDVVATTVDGPGTGADRLADAIAALLTVMETRPAVCRALVAELGRAGRIPDIVAAVQTAYIKPVERVLRDGAADGTLKAIADPELAALSIFGSVTVTGLGFVVEGNRLSSASVDQLTDVILTGLVAGGRPRPTAKPGVERRRNPRRRRTTTR